MGCGRDAIRGRVLVDLAVPIAEGAETISDIAVLADQPTLVGPLASDSTCWRHFKHSFGYHPLLAFCDNTGEFLAAQLRAGNAGSNTAADHITVLDAALTQVPDAYRHGHPVLIRG